MYALLIVLALMGQMPEAPEVPEALGDCVEVRRTHCVRAAFPLYYGHCMGGPDAPSPCDHVELEGRLIGIEALDFMIVKGSFWERYPGACRNEEYVCVGAEWAFDCDIDLSAEQVQIEEGDLCAFGHAWIQYYDLTQLSITFEYAVLMGNPSYMVNFQGNSDDYDQDLDLDLRDFAEYQNAFPFQHLCDLLNWRMHGMPLQTHDDGCGLP